MGSCGRGLEHPHRLIHHEKSLMPSSPSPGAPADAPLSLGIDIGGTFTDIVVIDPSSGNAVIWKESTTPDDPARGTMLGLWKLVERSGIALERIGRVIHATTLFTNALIERKGAPTGLITMAGFADVLEIGRERMEPAPEGFGRCASVPMRRTAERNRRLLSSPAMRGTNVLIEEGFELKTTY
jgi:hypothetical protein